jgi:hypothetical protein
MNYNVRNIVDEAAPDCYTNYLRCGRCGVSRVDFPISRHLDYFAREHSCAQGIATYNRSAQGFY